MKKVTLKDVEKIKRDASLFTGSVYAQTVIEHQESDNFNFSIINFPKGVRTKFHTHSGDQILIITKGYGKVCNEEEELDVTEGDMVLINAGENHWHGATEETTMSHITITVEGSETTQTED
jgi:quercetin dioxygenase-like cupin family protein